MSSSQATTRTYSCAGRLDLNGIQIAEPSVVECEEIRYPGGNAYRNARFEADLSILPLIKGLNTDYQLILDLRQVSLGRGTEYLPHVHEVIIWKVRLTYQVIGQTVLVEAQETL